MLVRQARSITPSSVPREKYFVGLTVMISCCSARYGELLVGCAREPVDRCSFTEKRCCFARIASGEKSRYPVFTDVERLKKIDYIVQPSSFWTKKIALGTDRSARQLDALCVRQGVVSARLPVWDFHLCR